MLFRIPRLWYCLLIQTATLKPTPYAPMRAVCAYINYIPMGILVSQCFGLYEFTRFRNAKTKRVRRLFQYVLYLTHPKDIFPRRGLNTGAKVQQLFEICNTLSTFEQFFLTFLQFCLQNRYFLRDARMGVIFYGKSGYSRPLRSSGSEVEDGEGTPASEAGAKDKEAD